MRRQTAAGGPTSATQFPKSVSLNMGHDEISIEGSSGDQRRVFARLPFASAKFARLLCWYMDAPPVTEDWNSGASELPNENRLISTPQFPASCEVREIGLPMSASHGYAVLCLLPDGSKAACIKVESSYVELANDLATFLNDRALVTKVWANRLDWLQASGVEDDD